MVASTMLRVRDIRLWDDSSDWSTNRCWRFDLRLSAWELELGTTSNALWKISAASCGLNIEFAYSRTIL